jgi:hypothetical protein
MNPVTGLSLGRIAVGVASLVKPDLLTSPVGQRTSRLITRMFGVREIGLGAATLLARGGARRNLVLIGMAVDGGDAAASLAGIQGGDVKRPTGYGLVGIACGAVLAGALGLVAGRGRGDVAAS